MTYSTKVLSSSAFSSACNESVSMDFGFSAEQEMLRASARKFFENECTSTVVRQRMEEPAGVTDDFWTKLAEQGWLGLVYPEEYGGVGLGCGDLPVLIEELGS